MKFYLSLVLLFISSIIYGSTNQKKRSSSTQTKDKPNILFIIADDLGCDASPLYNVGDLKPNMPNIESFTKKGVRFTNFWAYPTCTPTRASIITGKQAFRTNVKQPGDELNVGENILQTEIDKKTNNAYSSAVIGKWHLSNDPEHPNKMGINYYSGLLSGGVRDYSMWRHTENGVSTRETEYITSKFTDLAIDWINKQQKPWFLWLAYTAPHTPFHLPPSNLHSSKNLKDSEVEIENNPQPYFFSMIEALDTEIGRLLNAIPKKELDNTVIIFIGDNGTPNQVEQTYGRRRVKGSIYQGGINVPLVVSGKNVERVNEVEDALINSTDLFATILELASSEVNLINDSKSFVPLFNKSMPHKNYLYSELKNKRKSGYAIRNEQYKYISYDNGVEELYDLQKDPFERNNLINDSSYKKIKEALVNEVNEMKK